MAPRKKANLATNTITYSVTNGGELIPFNTNGDVVRVEILADIPTKIEKLSVDYGREDLNNMAKKINELSEEIDALKKK